MTTRLDDRTVLDAFVDGERVDPDDLKQALADAEGRDYFVDIWLLREAVQEAPAAGVVAGGLSPSRNASASKWLVAAALLVGLGGGYLVGNRPASTSTVPPAATAQNTPVVRPAFPAPAPTLVIPVEFHADTTRSGGD